MRLKFSVLVTNGNQPVSEWLAGRIALDVKEKYGIDIQVEVNQLKEAVPAEGSLKPGSQPPQLQMNLHNVEDLPKILTPREVQFLLGIGRRQVYELLINPPFHVVRVGKRKIIKISRESFLGWLNGTNKI
jgi:hypothetical protein